MNWYIHVLKKDDNDAIYVHVMPNDSYTNRLVMKLDGHHLQFVRWLSRDSWQFVDFVIVCVACRDVGANLTVPDGAKVIDATGKLVIPGY